MRSGTPGAFLPTVTVATAHFRPYAAAAASGHCGLLLVGHTRGRLRTPLAHVGCAAGQSLLGFVEDLNQRGCCPTTQVMGHRAGASPFGRRTQHRPIQPIPVSMPRLTGSPYGRRRVAHIPLPGRSRPATASFGPSPLTASRVKYCKTHSSSPRPRGCGWAAMLARSHRLLDGCSS